MREEKDIRQLKAFVKLLALVMLGVLVAEMGSCARQAHAAVIMGEKPLAGFSFYRQMLIDAKQTLPEREDLNLLAEVIYHENWHTDSEHLAAYYTGAVVLNRVQHSEFPDTIRGVLYQKGQYSTTHKFFTKTLPEECYSMARDLLLHGSPDVPESIVFQAMFRQGKGVWKKVNTDYFCY